jgi:hypothetical protein
MCSKSADRNKKNKEELEYRIRQLTERICRENPCFHGVRSPEVEISGACLA